MSPFKSNAQRRLCYSLQKSGKGGWDCAKWEAETKGSLPERIHQRSKSAKSASKSTSKKRSRYFTKDVLEYIGKKGRTVQSVIRHFSERNPSAVKGAVTRLKNSGDVVEVAGKIRKA
jgi:hypothetical protein